MIRVRLPWLLHLVLLGFGIALCGCAQSAPAYRKYYALDTTRQGGPTQIHTDATLRLRRFNVDEAFASRELVNRLDEFRYETDYYHQFLVPPGVMITEKTRDWLANSGLFGRVTAAGGRVESTYLLEGNVIDLYADFRKASAPVAILEIRFFLLVGAEASESVALAETYKAAAPISDRTAEAVVEAFSRDLDDILPRLEGDVEKVIARTPNKGLP
jgi:cholesterol transport system auxiliary component